MCRCADRSVSRMSNSAIQHASRSWTACHLMSNRHDNRHPGATGSGKSSLVHLLLRLYDYQDGSITIDGVELSTISRAWIRRNVGMVLQEPFLFSRNIRENIRVGRPGASDDDVQTAAKIACVDEAITEFDAGYDTVVGERGVTLSGGQRQRVAIARTILRDVPILIFDDSLSAVDTETDASIRAALKSRRQGTTTLIISIASQRWLSRPDPGPGPGCIVQRGTHDELIRGRPLQADLGIARAAWKGSPDPFRMAYNAIDRHTARHRTQADVY